MRSARAIFKLSICAFTLVASAACNLDNLGDPPPEGDIYLPTGLMLSAQTRDSAPRFLYLVNSNFDLRYNRGSVQAIDLDAVDKRVRACDTPSAACQIAASDVLVDEVLVPSLATSFGITADHSRMYIATRTDPSLLFIDLDEAGGGERLLQCDEADRRCSDNRRRGADANDNDRRELLPQEPVDLLTVPASSVSDDPAEPGTFVMIAHRAGQVSLFYDNGLPADANPDKFGPTLIDVRDSLPLELTGLVFDPVARLAYLSVYARNDVAGLSRVLSRAGITFQRDASNSPRASFVYDAGSVVIDGVAAQRDTRAIVMNPQQAGQALVASRDPAALLFVDVGPASDGRLPATNVPARQITDLAAGPSRMTLGEMGTRNIVAVSCFDGHALYVLDVATSDVLAIVHNLNGPFELAIDSARARLYLADFRSSSVQVIDLSAIAADGTSTRTDAPIIATLGIPKVVQELQ